MDLNKAEWQFFRLEELFEVKTARGFDEGKLNIEEQKSLDSLEFVGRTRSNNGVKGYIRKLELTPNREETISVSQVGTITAQVRKEKWYASQNIFILTPLINNEKLISLFVVSVINKALASSFSDGYGNYPTLDKLRNLTIQLPIKNGDIDFEFMDGFIAELEADRIAELEAYLKSAGLDDYHLTAEEKSALDDLESGNLSWGEFTYKDIFNNIKQGRRLKKSDQIKGDIPFVMSGTTNTGVFDYISNPVAKFPKNSITIDIFGSAFYRNFDFGAGDDTGVYWSDEENYSEEEMLFFTTSMQKSIAGKFSYGHKLRSSQSFDFTMRALSVNGQPDRAKMKALISAVKKTLIRDVVEYADNKILAHKKVTQH